MNSSPESVVVCPIKRKVAAAPPVPNAVSRRPASISSGRPPAKDNKTTGAGTDEAVVIYLI